MQCSLNTILFNLVSCTSPSPSPQSSVVPEHGAATPIPIATPPPPGTAGESVVELLLQFFIHVHRLSVYRSCDVHMGETVFSMLAWQITAFHKLILKLIPQDLMVMHEFPQSSMQCSPNTILFQRSPPPPQRIPLPPLLPLPPTLCDTRP